MSYERAGFDPTNTAHSPFPVNHLDISGVHYYTVDFPRIMERADNGATLTLIDQAATSTDVAHVSAELLDGSNYKDQEARLYSGNIVIENPKGNYLEVFKELIDETNFDNIGADKARGLHFNNARRIDNTAGTFSSAVIYYSNTSKIYISNQVHLDCRTGREAHRLNAPRKDVLTDRDQYRHFLSSIGLGVHLANGLRDGELQPLDPCVFVITPDGPLYKNPDTGEYVHTLKRQETTLRTASPKGLPAPKPAKQEITKTERRVEDTRFEDLYGIDDIIEDLQPLVLYYKNPEVAKKWHARRPSGVFLKGPGGTAKTSIIYALANEIGADVREVRGEEVYGQLMGDSQRQIAAIFDEIRGATKPTILFFDELESIISSTDSKLSGSQTVNAVAGIFKRETSRIAEANPNVIFAGASNHPDRVDETLIRSGRFDIRINVGLPNEAARRQIFCNLIMNLADISVDIPDAMSPSDAPDTQPPDMSDRFQLFDATVTEQDELHKLSQLASGFSGADIVKIIESALLRKAYLEATGKQPAPVSAADLQAEIKRHNRGTVS